MNTFHIMLRICVWAFLYANCYTCLGQTLKIQERFPSGTTPGWVGEYQPNGTSDGVTAYQSVSGGYYLFRDPLGLFGPDSWVLADASDVLSATNLFDWNSLGGNTPPLTSGWFSIVLSITSAAPVDLISFLGDPEGASVALAWQTASEQNNQGFEIQRSFDAEVFLPVGWVEGNGTTSQQNHYAFRDKSLQAFSGFVYYRLKQIDFDGAFTLSSIVSVNMGSSESQPLSVTNNPVAANTLFLVFPKGNWERLEIRDLTGKLKRKEGPQKQDGKMEIPVSTLEPGFYLVILSAQHQVLSTKFIKSPSF
ncbi:MAG: T9SS type A sorting domain-containing protein [Bacteroidota bacterium]